MNFQPSHFSTKIEEPSVILDDDDQWENNIEQNTPDNFWSVQTKQIE